MKTELQRQLKKYAKLTAGARGAKQLKYRALLNAVLQKIAQVKDGSLKTKEKTTA